MEVRSVNKLDKLGNIFENSSIDLTDVNKLFDNDFTSKFSVKFG